MKGKFSTSWTGSKQARKQRKYRANISLHLKRKLLSSNLSEELRKKYSRRSFPVRKSDTVKIMRGKFSGKVGKIASINFKKMKLSIDGIQKSKKDGTKVPVLIDASKVQIQEFNLDDKERIASLEVKNKNNQKIRETKEKK